MGDFTREYLELLAEKYPNEAAVCSEIINLNAILTLPKGTEHFISDLHGEYGAVRHILNNCSGVILEKVRRLFEETEGEAKCRALCSVIYYPRAELACLRERGELDNSRLREILEQLCLLAETLSGKYTRGYVRRQMPADWEFVLTSCSTSSATRTPTSTDTTMPSWTASSLRAQRTTSSPPWPSS